MTTIFGCLTCTYIFPFSHVLMRALPYPLVNNTLLRTTVLGEAVLQGTSLLFIPSTRRGALENETLICHHYTRNSTTTRLWRRNGTVFISPVKLWMQPTHWEWRHLFSFPHLAQIPEPLWGCTPFSPTILCSNSSNTGCLGDFLTDQFFLWVWL
jgi:hypothetical protein